MRSRLQEKVNDVFARMYHGKRRVQIDNQYHVTLFAQMNSKEVVTGESEGLKRVKNFAFIAGLVDLAKEKASLGKNSEAITWDNEAYPLVMDSPFSNADAMPRLESEQLDAVYSSLKNIGDRFKVDKELIFNSKRFAEALKEKSAESADYDLMDLSDRQKQILDCMKLDTEYSTEEITREIGLKGPRTRQLLNELVTMGFVSCTAVTKNSRYVRIKSM